MSKEIGERIIFLRDFYKVTQEQLAAKVKMPLEEIKQIEQGTQTATPRQLLYIATALMARYGWVAKGE